MAKKKPTCSIIIRCYNEELHIGKLLSGIMEQTVKDVEIVLVDSGSTDATLSIASRYPVKVLNIKPEDFSFGRALNIGCKAATGTYLVIASAHVYPVYKDWLANMTAPFKNKDVALVYGMQRGGEEARFSEQQIYKKWFPETSINTQDHPFCNNANSVIRASLWKKFPFNEELTGLEDLDWAKRATAEGHKTVYSAEAEIIHIHDETPLKVLNRYQREAIAFKRIYPEEHFLLKDFIKLTVANTFTDYFHALQDGLLFRNIISIPVFRFMQFLGTYRGYAQHGGVTTDLRNRFYYPNGLIREARISEEKNTERKINYEHH
ncbi:MAG: glycosyltransferase family A protein [Thermodesulfobacteriota bacterium]